MNPKGRRLIFYLILNIKHLYIRSHQIILLIIDSKGVTYMYKGRFVLEIISSIIIWYILYLIIIQSFPLTIKSFDVGFRYFFYIFLFIIIFGLMYLIVPAWDIPDEAQGERLKMIFGLLFLLFAVMIVLYIMETIQIAVAGLEEQLP